MRVKAAIFSALFAAGCEAKRDSIGSKSKAFASECRTTDQGRRCKWDDTDLDLDTEVIRLTVGVSGPTITCHRNHVASKPGSFVGQCNGAAQSANFIERQDKFGKQHVCGSIVVGEEICHMSKKVVSCENASDYPDEEEMEAPQPEEGERDLAAVAQNLRGKGLDLGGGGGGRRLYDDRGGNLDVMVVWTKDAECRQSGFSPGCTLDDDTETEMRALVDLAVEETNTAFKLSGINTQLRLVHAYLDDTYTEPSTNKYPTMVTNLQNKNDKKLDSVHREREKYGADFVAMIAGSGGSCGIAYSGPSIYASKMFSVIRYSCATGAYSFGHELAHNAGCFHDRGAMKQCSSGGYNYGWRDPNANFRSILAYNCASNQCDNNAGGGCPRVPMFSNPVYTYKGQPIGDASSDNRRVFNNNKGAIASLFPAMDCQVDADCDDGNSCTIDTCNTSNGACVHETDYATCAQSCPAGQKNFQLYLDTDNSGNQITWSLVNDCTGSTVSSGSGYGNNKVYNIDECVDEKTQYRFTISDTASNGLCCSNGYGEYVALYDGSIKSKGTSFGSSDTITFGTCPAPTATPTELPTDSPTDAPVPAPYGVMEWFVVNNVNNVDQPFTSVALTGNFMEPIPVCTVVYSGDNLLPAVVRLQNVAADSFEIALQNPSGSYLAPRDVNCLVVEKGSWRMPNGDRVEARSYSSSATDRKNSWIGEVQPALEGFEGQQPVVIGQVMSYNDPGWSVFWSRGSSRYDPASSTTLYTGKHVGEDSVTTRADEVVGYIAFETRHGIVGSVEYEAANGGDTVRGYGNSVSYSHMYDQAFTNTPELAIVAQVAMDGGDGSWASVTDVGQSSTAISLVLDEDQIGDADRWHTTEQVAYVAFSRQGSMMLTLTT